MKAQTGLEILLMGIIGTYTILAVGILPASTVKLTEEKQTLFEYSYNKVQLLLLNILSATENDKRIYETIAENLAIDRPSNLDFLKNKLDKLIESKCYQLNSSTKVLLEVENCEPNYIVNATIALPYNPDKLIEEIRVGVK